MKNIFIIFAVLGFHFIFAQQSLRQQLVVNSLSYVSKSTGVKIKIKDDIEIKTGTIYRFNSSKLILNTSRLQRLCRHPLTEKYKVLSEISINEIQQIQVKKTNNRNAWIASGLLAVGLLSQANKPEMEGSASGFVWLPISLTPFLLKPYFSYSWETVFNANI